MSKPLRHKKDKVPKITEEEYAAYVRGLKGELNTPTQALENEKISGKGAKA